MSVTITNLVWAHAPYKGAHLLVLLAMADYADDDGICWPAQTTLAQKCRVDRRTIQRVLDRLEEDKVITLIRPSAQHNSARYQIQVGTIHSLSTGVENPSRGDTTPLLGDSGAASDPSGAVFDPSRGGMRPPDPLEPSKEPPEEPEFRKEIPDLSLEAGHAIIHWNDAARAYDLPKVKKWTAERKRRIREVLKAVGLDGWKRAMSKIGESPWLKGENERGWRVTIDFVLRVENITKILEGAYDESKNRKPRDAGARLDRFNAGAAGLDDS